MTMPPVSLQRVKRRRPRRVRDTRAIPEASRGVGLKCAKGAGLRPSSELRSVCPQAVCIRASVGEVECCLISGNLFRTSPKGNLENARGQRLRT